MVLDDEKLKRELFIEEIESFKLYEKFPDEIALIVANLYDLKENADFNYLSQTEKHEIEEEKIVLDNFFEFDREKIYINEEVTIRNNVRGLKNEYDKAKELNLTKFISLSLFKSAITSIIIEACSELNGGTLKGDQFYLNKIDLVEELNNLFDEDKLSTEINCKNETYSLDKEKRISFFLNEPSYIEWIQLVETIEYEEEDNFSPLVAKALLPYYLYSIYQSSSDEELNINIKTLFNQSVEYSGRYKKIYAWDKYRNFTNQFEGDMNFVLELLDIQMKKGTRKGLNTDKTTKYYSGIIDQIKDGDFEKLSNYRFEYPNLDLDLLVKECRKLVNFDKKFYYFALKFYDFKNFIKIITLLEVKFDFSSSLNLLILNRFDRLYDAMYLIPKLSVNKPELIYDTTSLAAIMKIEDFELKEALITYYDSDFRIDYVVLKDTIKLIIEKTKKHLLKRIAEIFKLEEESYEVYQLALEYFGCEDDKRLINNLKLEMQKWENLNDIEKLDFIEYFGNNLLLLYKLDIDLS